MDDPAITGLLNELHDRLESGNTISEKDRELLTQLSVDLQSLLADPDGPAAAKHRSIIDRLRDSIASFEIAHPDLTDVLSRISRVLSDMGI